MNRRLALRIRAQGMQEKVDPTPIEVTADRRPLSLKEQLQAYIRQQVSLAASNEGYGTFEEEDDYEEDENEGEWISPHELRNMQPIAPDGDPLETMDGTDDSPPPPPAEPEPPPVADTGGNA